MMRPKSVGGSVPINAAVAGTVRLSPQPYMNWSSMAWVALISANSVPHVHNQDQHVDPASAAASNMRTMEFRNIVSVSA